MTEPPEVPANSSPSNQETVTLGAFAQSPFQVANGILRLQMAGPNPARYTAQGLVAATAAIGLVATERLVRDWVGVGLLDRPSRPPLSKGKGQAPGTWPENQFRLFLKLLKWRQEGAQVAALCNFVVWLWLVWGDDYASVGQVERALRTWLDAAMRPTLAGSERAAVSSARSLPTRSTRRGVRLRFRMALTDAQLDPDHLDRQELLSAAREAFDPERSGSPRGPEGAVVTPELYVDRVELIPLVAARFKTLRDEDFLFARDFYRYGRADYQENQPRFAADAELGHLFEVPSTNAVMNAACGDLAVVLGLGLKAQITTGRSNHLSSSGTHISIT